MSEVPLWWGRTHIGATQPPSLEISSHRLLSVSVWLSDSLSMSLSVCLSFTLSFPLRLSVAVCLSIRLSLSLSHTHSSVCMSVSLYFSLTHTHPDRTAAPWLSRAPSFENSRPYIAHGCPALSSLRKRSQKQISSYTSILGDILFWVGVPCASSALAEPLPETSSLHPPTLPLRLSRIVFAYQKQNRALFSVRLAIIAYGGQFLYKGGLNSKLWCDEVGRHDLYQ